MTTVKKLRAWVDNTNKFTSAFHSLTISHLLERQNYNDFNAFNMMGHIKLKAFALKKILNFK